MKAIRDSVKAVGATVALIVTSPAFAFAAEHHEEEFGVDSLIWPAVNFFLYVSLMVYLYKRFVRPLLVSRAAVFEQHLQKAAGVLEDAERELGRAEHRLREIETEQKEIRNRLTADGEHLAARLIEQAHENAAAIKRDVARRIEQETSQAQSEIRQLVIQRATGLARQALERGISPEQDRRLRDQTLKALNVG